MTISDSDSNFLINPENVAAKESKGIIICKIIKRYLNHKKEKIIY